MANKLKNIMTAFKLVCWYELVALLPSFMTALVYNWSTLVWVCEGITITPSDDLYDLKEDFWRFFSANAEILYIIAIVAFIAALVHAFVRIRKD